MIASARIFLILLVPLLVPGAPTEPYSGSPHKSLKDLPWPPEKATFIPNGFILPVPGHAAQGSYGINPARPIDFTNANRPPPLPPHESTSFGGLLHTAPIAQAVNPARMEGNTKTTCVLLEGTWYRTPPSSELHMLKEAYVLNDRVAIVHGGIVLLRKGTTVKLTNDPNKVDVPMDSTIIRKINERDRHEVEEKCRRFHERTLFLRGMESINPYVVRCSDINFWNIGGVFVEVPVKQIRDLNLAVICRLLKGTKYRRVPSSIIYTIKGSRIKEDRVIIMPEGKFVLLPAGTEIILVNSPDDVNLPTGDTLIREVSTEDALDTQNRCEVIYHNTKAPTGWRREPWNEYVRRCSDVNYWTIGANWIYVPIGFSPQRLHASSANRRPTTGWPTWRPASRLGT